MSTRARGEGVKGMGVYDCWVQGLLSMGVLHSY